MIRLRRALACIGVFFALLVPFTGSAEEQTVDVDPAAPVDLLNATLAEIAAAGLDLTYEQRFDQLEPVVTEAYNLPLMTRLVVGSGAWSDLSEDDQAALIDGFERMSIAAYAARFGGEPGGQDLHFSVSEVADGPRRTKLVSSFLELKQQDDVKFSYVMRQAETGWRIVDVIIDDQYSELSRRRADFGAILSAGGVAALLERIDEIVGKYQSDS
ncbi:MAG: ABC transporter substrate-binding protein [Alphaproteobacteria bacterium]|nr:ABC transporter substrate-binding protein [Alphaproteobacteria bacterium SS10]